MGYTGDMIGIYCFFTYLAGSFAAQIILRDGFSDDLALRKHPGIQILVLSHWTCKEMCLPSESCVLTVGARRLVAHAGVAWQTFPVEDGRTWQVATGDFSALCPDLGRGNLSSPAITCGLKWLLGTLNQSRKGDGTPLGLWCGIISETIFPLMQHIPNMKAGDAWNSTPQQTDVLLIAAGEVINWRPWVKGSE